MGLLEHIQEAMTERQWGHKRGDMDVIYTVFSSSTRSGHHKLQIHKRATGKKNLGALMHVYMRPTLRAV